MTSRKKAAKPVPRLELSAADRVALRVLARKKVKARVWRRVRILQLLHQGWTMAGAATAAGTYPREVRRVRQHFLAGGLAEARRHGLGARATRHLTGKPRLRINAAVPGSRPRNAR